MIDDGTMYTLRLQRSMVWTAKVHRLMSNPLGRSPDASHCPHT
jgi:hypothetical protein